MLKLHILSSGAYLQIFCVCKAREVHYANMANILVTWMNHSVLGGRTVRTCFPGALVKGGDGVLFGMLPGARGSFAALLTWSAAPGAAPHSESWRLAAVLSSAVLAMLLVIGGVELNPGPSSDAVLQPHAITCAGCERNLRSGAQCDKCYRWYHYSCGNVKSRFRSNEEWTRGACRVSREQRADERIRELEQELKTTKRLLEDCLKRNKELEEQLQASTSSVSESTTNADKGTEKNVLVLGDSIVRHTGTGNEALDVRCFPGIRTAQLRRVIESQDMGRPDAVILHVVTNDSKRNVDYVIGDIYELVTAARKKFPTAKLILSGLLRRRDTRWTRIGLINDGMDWVARSLGVQMVDANAWIADGDLGRDGLHLNRRGASKLGRLFTKVSAHRRHSRSREQLRRKSGGHR